MIDWIDSMLQEWGESKRNLRSYRPLTSVFGRIKDGWSIAAAEGSDRPCPPEVHLGDALIVNNAIQRALAASAMPERLHEILYVHYVWWTPRVKQKWALLELPARRYYKRLHRAHIALKPFMEGEGAQQNEIRAACL